MVRLPRSGVTSSALHERPAGLEELIFEDLVVLFLVGLASQKKIVKAYNEAVKALADLGLTNTLLEVIADLGLQPLSGEDEAMIRGELGLIIGRGEEIAAASPTLSGRNNVAVAKVQATLLEIADVLEATIDRSSADLNARAEWFAGRHLSPKRVCVGTS